MTPLVLPLSVAEVEVKSGFCRLVGWFLGSGSGSQAPKQQAPVASEQLPDITEDRVKKYAVDANALIMMAVAVFMWGYYAWQPAESCADLCKCEFSLIILWE